MAQSFQQLGVPADLIKGLDELGIQEPTPIQRRAIPFLMDDGGDLIAQAQTGTGKTAAFGLPLLAKIDPTLDQIQGLVIAPTRELAKQIGKQLFKYTKYCEQKIFVEVAAGGDKIAIQAERLQRPTHIVVATPGRLMDLLELDALSLESVNHLILDEADEMLSMGFKEELAKIIKLTEWRRSLWLFSATFQAKIRQLIEGSMSPQAHRIKVEKADVVNPNIDHRFVICERDEKDEFIVQYLSRLEDERGLIFCRTKQGAIRMGQVLTQAGFAV
ncbi:MAG: DEAD/DEAH box helicase, partial [Coraliomargarita sp.]